MVRAILILLCFSLVLGCASSKKAIGTSANQAFVSNKSDNDGSSYEKAIVIEEKTEGAGVAAEYAWIRKNYPGSQSGSQALMYKDKTPYDVLDIVTSSGEKKKIYFNIINYFGKF
jgi:hypothetical protein